jgi:hypothetical protein
MQNLNRNPSPHRRARLSCALVGLALSSVLFGGLSSDSLAAQAPPEKTGPPNRWLIVVDTSRGMELRADNARQIAGILIVSGMNGQMRRGDEVGLWTFNRDLYAGQFPMQEYKPETTRNVAQRVLTFLEEQKNEKSSRLEKVMPELDRLIKASEFITVFIISDGSSKITGTPYDDKINDAFKSWRTQQDKSHMPFVTILRARHGQFTDFSVSMPPWQLDLPPLPADLRPPPAAALPPPAAPKPAAGVRLPPEPSKPPAGSLIVSGKTPAPDSSLITVTANSNATNPAPNSTNLSVIARVVPVQPAKAEEHPHATSPGVMPVMAAEIAKTNTNPPPPVPPVDSHPTAQDASSSAKPEVPIHTVMSAFSSGIVSPRNLFIAVVVLIAVLFVMMISRSRQPQTPPRISLITRSLDQQ